MTETPTTESSLVQKQGKTKQFAIYVITNKVTCQQYVGQTGDPHGRWLRHKSAARQVPSLTNRKAQRVNAAMWAYGEDLFTFDILEWCPDQDSADSAEDFWIRLLGTQTKGYNAIGGGSTTSERGRAYLSLLHKNKHISPSTEFKKGHSQPLAIRQRISEGMKRHWEGLRAQANKGRVT